MTEPGRVEINYTNHRGERSKRVIHPKMIKFAKTLWHEQEQWLLFAWDVDKAADRAFAMSDIHSWRNLP